MDVHKGLSYELGFNFQSMQFKQTWGRLDVMNAHMISHFCVSVFKCHLNNMCVIQSLFWVQTIYKYFLERHPFMLNSLLLSYYLFGEYVEQILVAFSQHFHVAPMEIGPSQWRHKWNLSILSKPCFLSSNKPLTKRNGHKGKSSFSLVLKPMKRSIDYH